MPGACTRKTPEEPLSIVPDNMYPAPEIPYQAPPKLNLKHRAPTFFLPRTFFVFPFAKLVGLAVLLSCTPIFLLLGSPAPIRPLKRITDPWGGALSQLISFAGCNHACIAWASRCFASTWRQKAHVLCWHSRPYQIIPRFPAHHAMDKTACCGGSCSSGWWAPWDVCICTPCAERHGRAAAEIAITTPSSK